MRRILIVALVGAMVLTGVSAVEARRKDAKMLESEARKIVDEYVAKYMPLDLKLRRAWYKYGTTGDKRASNRQAKMELAIRTLNSDPERFAKLKELYGDRKRIRDDIIRRQVEILYHRHLNNQVAPEKLKRLTRLEQRIQQIFNDYRPEVDGKKLTPVEVSHILSDSTDSKRLEKVWKAHKAVGSLLERDYRQLVKLRNEIARDLGYRDAVELASVVSETDLKMLDRFYDDVHRYTEKPFRKLKEEYIDPRLAKRYGISTKDLRPWHYQNAFFQEAPTAIFGRVDLDDLYSKVDSKHVVGQTIDFYGSMGVDIQGIIDNSSLYPKPGKNPHAVAWYLDPNKPGNAVLIMNLPRPPEHPKASEASTLVHELAHDINYEAILQNDEVPYLLREPTMLTEAVAMLFEKQTLTDDWFVRLGVPAKKAQEVARAVELIDYVDQLIFLRWSSVIYCFERSFYADPDQDIGQLWWSCKARHQFLDRPEGWNQPDALAKYHIPNVTPLYYSNYAIGRVANVQFAELLAKRINQPASQASYFGQRQLGGWLMDDFLAQGERYRWDEFLIKSTGKPLSVKAWKRHYIDSDLGKRLFSAPPPL